jgi:hypothetical protein
MANIEKHIADSLWGGGFYPNRNKNFTKEELEILEEIETKLAWNRASHVLLIVDESLDKAIHLD